MFIRESQKLLTFLCNPIAYLHRLYSPDIVLSAIPALQINSSLLSGAYQVHLYVEYKYLHFRYIQCRLGPGPKHVLPFAVQIEFHFAPEKRPALEKELVFNVSPFGREHMFLSFNGDRDRHTEPKRGEAEK